MKNTSNATVELAMGRLFRLMAGPAMPGDVVDYERCRRVILAELAPVEVDYRPNYARDHARGAAGK